MAEEFYNNSYNNIKRLADEELEALWKEYFQNRSNKKVRDTQEYKDLIHRLNRIEGQVRGVKGMVENDAYCVDILTQVSAITSALNSFNKVLLANHIKTCVSDDIRAGREEKVDELVVTLQKLMK